MGVEVGRARVDVVGCGWCRLVRVVLGRCAWIPLGGEGSQDQDFRKSLVQPPDRAGRCVDKRSRLGVPCVLK